MSKGNTDKTPSPVTCSNQSALERVGRRVMLVCGAMAYGFARSDTMLMLTAGMMILIYPMFVGLVLPTAAFIISTEGVQGPARIQAIIISSSLTVVLEYFAFFGTLGLVKGFIAGTSKVEWQEFKRRCLSDELMIGGTFFIGAGIVLVIGMASAAIMKILSLVGLWPK